MVPIFPFLETAIQGSSAHFEQTVVSARGKGFCSKCSRFQCLLSDSLKSWRVAARSVGVKGCFKMFFS